ncbi:tripartite tricarboxylate transporter TctB family protein [Salibacterium aidingense]|uniref:tripartite tricarboxylate transporter TctB family protein n=1 Tax=Salibacterium aidingense TaxID=384933 RepID=UPI000417F937|nr:tripartite tricarboxylate transporter TctB family protein [Salibacterium aidingense]
MKEQIKDRYVGVTLFFSGLLSWFIIIPYGIESNGGLTTVGPDFFPRFITVSIVFLSMLLVMKSFSKDSNQKEEDLEENQEPKGKPWVGLLVFVIMLGYIYLADFIGYLYSTIISMSLIMWILSVRKWYLYGVLIIVIFLIQYVFENIMYIRLP